MLLNYIKLAWRSLIKNRLYSIITVSGLALAYAACALIYLHVKEEMSYDRNFSDSDRIYRVVKDFVNDDGTSLPDATTPPALIPAIRQEIPEVEESVRIFPSWGGKFLVKRGETSFYEDKVFRADSNVFNIFDFEFLSGNPAEALMKPGSVVITESIARKYFGEEEPLGKNLEIGGGKNNLVVVSGVIKDLPSTMHFHFDFLLPQMINIDQRWGWYNWYSYIKLKPGTRIATVEPKIVALFKKHNPENTARYYTQALSDLHLHSKLKWELESNGDITFVKIFVTIGLFIILIASVNYINLSIVQALNRAKEVGIRKVSGAYNRGLVGQFLTESIVFSFVALLVGMALVEITLPYFNAYFDKNILPLSRQSPGSIALIFGTGLAIGILSGFYPAVYLSAFKPVEVLKGVFQPGNRNLWFRKALVVLQFSISIALMAGTVIVVQQTDYLKSKELGFSKDQVLIVENVADVHNKQALKQALRNVPQVENVGGSNAWLGGLNWTTSMVAKGSTTSQLINTTSIDYDYLDVMKIQFAKGRNFSREFPSDTLLTVILNERAVRDLGITGDPVGALITDDAGADTVQYYRVVGVVKDFHFASLRQEIKPFGFFLRENWSNNIAVRINTSDFKGTINALQKAWASVEPNHPFEYFFLDESFTKLYQAEENFKMIFTGLTGMAIYIACSGLFAIASFFIRRRTKEIGIRKVLGASVQQITWLVSAEFMIIVLMANLVAWPLAYYFMEGWLDGFAYRIPMGLTSFFIAGAAALLIAALTVSVQSVKSAMSNPVKSLRNE